MKARRLGTGNRDGITLLEVLIAMTILATAATAALAAVAESGRASERWRNREVELVEAEQLLIQLSSLSRAELDLRLGERHDGAWLVEVQRPRQEFYRLAISDSITGSEEILVTVVHRAEPSR